MIFLFLAKKMPGGPPFSLENIIISMVCLLFTIPISWPIIIYVYRSNHQHSILYPIFYLILIPLWLVLAPIGIPLAILAFIHHMNR